jgi:hypothetical protein
MQTRTVFQATFVAFSAAALLVVSARAEPSVNYNSSKSNFGNVYFRDLNGKGRAALRTACAAHKGQIVTNDKGQMGCQVGSAAESKHITDGAAKGQADE